METPAKQYTIQEAAKHNHRRDCWIVVHGKIYDVTSYLDDHPGGDDVLLTASGRDSTDDFEDAGHSKSARELMQDYYIGELDSSPVIPELEIVKKEQQSELVAKLISQTFQYLAVPAAIIGISVIAGILYSRKK